MLIHITRRERVNLPFQLFQLISLKKIMKFRAIRSKSELYPQAITRQPDTCQPYIRQPYIRRPYIRRRQIYNNTELTFTAIKVEESKLDLNTEASSSFANVDHQTKSLIIEFENPGAG